MVAEPEVVDRAKSMSTGATASHIDFKLVGKPQTFSGSKSGLIEQSFQMKAYIVMSQMDNASELTVIEIRTKAIDLSTVCTTPHPPPPECPSSKNNSRTNGHSG